TFATRRTTRPRPSSCRSPSNNKFARRARPRNSTSTTPAATPRATPASRPWPATTGRSSSGRGCKQRWSERANPRRKILGYAGRMSAADEGLKASQTRLWKLIEERCKPGADTAAIDKRIWDLFGEDWAIMFTDLSGFSRRVSEFGIIHFLQTIYEQRKLLLPI